MKRTFTFLWVTLLCCIGMVKADVTDLPQITTDLENPIYYTIYNTRSSQPGGLMYYAGDAVGLKDGCSSLGNEYKFFFTGSHDALYIHNAATTNKLASVNSWTAEGIEWAVGVSPKGNGLAIGPKGGLNGNGCINEKNYETDANTSDFTTWSANDDGSIFVMELAEGYVFPMTDLFYVIECPLFEKAQGVKKALYVNAEGNAAWATEDLADLNYYWIPTLKEDGTAALKNLGTNKYLSNTAGEMSADAVYATINALGANSFNIKLGGNVLHADGHGGGNGASGGLTSWGGAAGSASAWQFVQREDPTKLQEAVVTYNLTYGDEVKYTQTVTTLVGEEWPAITVALPYTVSATKPEGVIAAEDLTDGAVTKEIALTIGELPFVAAADVESIDTWYYVKMHSNTPKYIQYLTDQTYLEWVDTEMDETAKDTYAWTFVGNIFDGFKVVNKAAAKAMQSTADGAVVLVDYADASQYVLAATRETTEAAKSGFCLRRPDANKECLNASAGKVAHWWDNDAGSTFMLEVVENEPELPEEPEGDEADYDLTEGTWSDATSYLANADFASIEGWTVAVDHVGESYGGTYYKLDTGTDPNTIEVYHTWGGTSTPLDQTKNFKFSQKVMLPAGIYCLKANGFYREGAEQNATTEKAWLFAGESTQNLVGIGTCGANNMGDAANVFKNGGCLNEFTFTVAEDGEVEIGFQGYINTTLSWVILGPVTLEKKVTLKDNFMEQAAAFTAFGQSSMALYSLGAVQEKWAEAMAVVDPLYGALAEGGKALKTEVVAAMELMTTTMAEIKPVVEYYDGKFTDTKWAMYDIQENSTANSDEVRAAFDDVLAAALNVSAVTTVAELEAKVAEMEAARQAYVLNAVPAEGFVFDYTFKVVNPDFNSNIDGWTCVNAGHNGGAGYNNVGGIAEIALWGAESWEASISQTLNELPNGKYIVKAAWMAASDIEMTFVANEGETTVTGIGDQGGNIDNDGNVVEMGQGFRGWQYVEVEGVVVDGTLTITVNSSSTTLHTWSNADEFELYYAGTIVEEPEQPEVDPNDYTSYIINADLSTGDAWNTDGTKGISGGMVKVASESAFDFSQTITLPAGQYKMTAKAVYRYTGSEAEEFAAIEAGTKTRLVNLYAETATYKYEADVMNRYDGASDTDYAAGNGSVPVNGKFVPNSSSAVQIWFNNGQYVNELVFNVQEEGQVKIGLTRTGGISGDYTNIGAWTLTRLGDAEADPKEEEPTPEPEYPADVTAQYLTNAGFDDASSWVTEGNVDKAAKDVANWTVTTTGDSWYYGAALGYGSAAMVNNAAIPATNPEGVAEGGALGISVGWGCIVEYTQNVVLPAGVYTVTYKAINVNDAATQASNLIGFKTADASYYGKNTVFAANTWVEESVTFVLEEETAGAISVGIGAISGGSGANAKLFIDGVTISYDPEIPSGGLVVGDVTDQFLANARFEQPSAQNGGAINTPPGWTLKHETSGWLDGSTRASTNPGGDGSQCYNLWAGTVSLADIYQTVTLPAGKYKLTVGFYSDGDAERYAYATVGGNTIKSANAKAGSWDFVSVEFSNPTEGEVTMGAVSKGWFQIDNVTLEYTGEVGKDDFVNAYNQALGEAQALVDQKMSAVAAAQLEATIAAYGSLTADNSIEELEAATDAILAELVSVKASVNSYKVLAVGTLPDNSLAGWTCTNGNTFQVNTWSGEGNSDGTNMVTPFIENWVGKESLLGNGKISYTLPGVNPGYYKVSSLIRVYSEANNDITGASFFANEVKTDFATGKPFTYNNMKGIYDVYTAVVNVGEEGVLEFGVEIENATFNWVAFKNVKIEYIGVIDQAAAEVLKSKIPTTKYDAALTAEVEALVAAIDAGVTFENYLALSEKVALAEASAAAYAANKTAIDGMFTLMASTNVYTAEAFAAYSAKAEDFLAQYEAGTLTATVDNPLSIHGWHATADYCEMLLSAFGIAVDDWANLHVNTWSTEGEADGSDFKVPFYEYWTGDGESLGVATKTATITGLTPGMYYTVEAWVRVRAKNGVAAADATGITLSVGEGEATDVTEGEVIGNSQFSHAVFTATGVADAEGNLTINFNVLDGNNVSWLAFKNLKYTEVEVVEPQYLPVVSAMAGDVEIVEGAATVESISTFDITFDRPVALAENEDPVWATLTDNWGDNSLKAEVLEENNCVVRFSLQWDVFTEAGDYYLYIPEGIVVGAEDANYINAAIEAVITIEAAPVTPLAVTNVTVGEDVMEGFTAVATPEDMIKVNFDGQFYFQGMPSIVDAEGNDASEFFMFANGLDVDGSNSYIFMGQKDGIYTITLAKASFMEFMSYKAPAEDIVLTVQIVVEPEMLPIVSAMVGDVEIVEGAATVESISTIDITFDRPVALAENAGWATLADSWGPTNLDAEVLEGQNVVRFSVSAEFNGEFTEAGEYILNIPEGFIVGAEEDNYINAEIAATITIEAAPATPLIVTNVTVGEDVMEGFTAVATPEDMIKVNFDGQFYFQGTPSIVDAEGNDASEFFMFANGLDVDGSNAYIFMGQKAGFYTITLAKASFMEFMSYKAPAEDIVLTVQILDGTDGIQKIEVDSKAVIYDLSGRRVNEMTKGIYIVNGKKVIKK